MSELQSRLAEAEETLDAIRSGSVDALVVHTPRGEQLFTLKGADQTYRTLVESMHEGALTLKKGLVSYCNQHFADMTLTPLEKIFGTSILDWIVSGQFESLLLRVQRGKMEHGSVEAVLRRASQPGIEVLVSTSRFRADGETAVGLIVTDISARKEAERVQQELSHRILIAQEQERQRVARDLHDGVSQLLASARYRLHNAYASHEAKQSQDIQQVKALLEKAMAEVRSISRNLRPSELDDLGLLAALRSLTNDFQARSGILAQFKASGPAHSFPVEAEMGIYRIAQEALNNVERHSRATQVYVSLTHSQKDAVLSVRDNGKGFSPPLTFDGKLGWGLQNMRERAALLKGTFSIKPLSKRGTHLSAQIPIERGRQPRFA